LKPSCHLSIVDPRQTSKKKKRSHWTSTEKDAVQRQFKNSWAMLHAPKRRQCELAISKETALTKRSWCDVKNCVHNMNQIKCRRIQAANKNC